MLPCIYYPSSMPFVCHAKLCLENTHLLFGFFRHREMYCGWVKINTYCINKMKQIYLMTETWNCIIEAMERAIHSKNRATFENVHWRGQRVTLSSGNKQKQKLVYSTHITTGLCCFYWLDEAEYEGWNFNSGNYLFTTDTK